jgi:glycosyltransferase involved in cell wall biosynthesis
VTRVLIYSDRGGRYGAEQVNHRLALALQRAGHAIAFAQPIDDHALPRERAAAGIDAYWLPDEDLYDPAQTAPSLVDGAPAERILDAARPDLVLFADSCPLANLAAKQTAVRRGIPYLVLVHCVQPSWTKQFRPHLPTLAAVYRDAVAVVAVSDDNLRLLHRFFGLPVGHGRVITNGRPSVFFEPPNPTRRERVRGELGIPADAVVALSIGRMELVKGWPDQLDALRRLRACPAWPWLHLVWVGDGTLAARIRHMARLLGGGQVTVLSNRNDVPALYDAADLLVHPARFEGMPLVVIEAMAKGLAIVATAVSGIPEAVADSGLLLAPAVAEPDLGRRLADTICALSDDTAARERLGRRARERALRHFTEVRMLDRYRALVAEAVGVAC